MNHDEFAFFNQQLARMLREGIPLEGALRQLCAGMKTNSLRAELQLLEADLAKGTSLSDAIGRRKLPELYKRMVQVGVQGNDLPGVLTLVADHYHRANALWTRLKGLMVYPILVVLVSLGLTVLVSLTINRFLFEFFYINSFNNSFSNRYLGISVWIPPILLVLAAILFLAVFASRRWRAKLRWSLPAFREASLAQLASSLALMVKNGTPLPDALALAQSLEHATPVARPLAQWQQHLAAGAGRPAQLPVAMRPLPALFLWLVQQSGEDLATGFQRAADVYQARANYRADLLLYGALPVSLISLGLLIVWQIAPLMQSMVNLMNSIGGD